MADTLNEKIRKMRIRREQVQKQIIDEAGMMHTSNRSRDTTKITSRDFDRAMKNGEEKKKLEKSGAAMSPEQKSAAHAAAQKSVSDEASKMAAEYNAKKNKPSGGRYFNKLKEDHMMFSDKKLGVEDSLIEAVKKAREFGRIEFDHEKRRLQEEAKKTSVTKPLNEEVEQVDELSKKTLKNYIGKASDSLRKTAFRSAAADADGEYSKSSKLYDKSFKRMYGIQDAAKRLAKEDADQVDEKFYGHVNMKNGKPATDEDEVKIGLAKLAAAETKTYSGGKEKVALRYRLGKNNPAAAEYNSKPMRQQTIKKKDATYAGVYTREDAEQVDEASRGRGRPKLPRDKNGKVIRDPEILAKMKASGEHEDGGVEHFIVQLRKVINLRGNYDVTYADGHKGRIPVAVAHRALQIHDNMKTASEKANFTHRASRSVSSFQDVLAGKKEEKHSGKPSLPKITALSK